MAAEQSIAQTLMETKIEAAKATIMTVREADSPVHNARAKYTTPRLGGPY